MEKRFEKPAVINDARYRFDSLGDGVVLFGKKGLPAMGWNSWNAFGTTNTEALTRAMADRIVELGLDKLGYQYIVLDDGCYGPSRVDGHLSSDEKMFPSGFMAISDYIHGKGLKLGMYNDIGSRLCSGLEVGACGYEDVDAKDYIGWKIDYIKVDNCYNLWDNATCSDPENARFTFAPEIYGIKLKSKSSSEETTLYAVKDGRITGSRAFIKGDYVTGIGTYDGTGPDASPIGLESSELQFKVDVPKGEYELIVLYRPGCVEGCGQWLQVAVNGKGKLENAQYFYDDFIEPETEEGLSEKNLSEENLSEDNLSEETASGAGSASDYLVSLPIKILLSDGESVIRLMNHRRQENTLTSYARIQEELKKAAPDNDIIFSICEWGKTQPQNWGYKVGNSWRILNDITFQVGSDGDSGQASWEGAYTANVTAQYNKAVIMDEFAGLDKGWNDPDMLMIGMNGLTETMCKTHMTMWCMMNSPLFLGLDLRNVEKDDNIFRIISNEDVIALNQDALGIQAKRIYTTKAVAPDTTYIRDNDRIDVLAKPLSDGSVALSFINVSLGERNDDIEISTDLIRNYLGDKIIDKASDDMLERKASFSTERYEIKDLWTKKTSIVEGRSIRLKTLIDGPLPACDNVTVVVKPV